jgi:hypothetical protein
MNDELFKHAAELAKKVKSKKNLCDYPFHCLPDIMKPIIEDCVNLYGVHSDIPASVCLGTVSASIGRYAKIKTHKYLNTGNLYILGSARSGTGKSITAKSISKPLFLREIEYKNQSRKSNSRAIVSVEMEKQEYERIKKDKHLDKAEKIDQLTKIKMMIEALEADARDPVFICEDVTSQKLAQIMSENNEQIAVISFEANSIYQQWLGKYNSGDPDENIYLASNTGDPVKVHRMGRPEITMSEPCLSLMALSTPDLMEKLFKNERFLTGGLLARCLVFESQSAPIEDDGKELASNVQAWNNWDFLIRRNFDDYLIRKADTVFRASKGACDVLREYGNEKVGNKVVSLDAFKARQSQKAERVALILHLSNLSNMSNEISRETAQNAVEIVRWYEAQIEVITSAGIWNQCESEAASLMQLLINQYRSGITLRDLKRKHGKKENHLRWIVEQFPNRFEIVTVKPETGRTSTVLRIKNG